MDMPSLPSLDSQIVEFIASGQTGPEVASMLGVSLSYIQERLVGLKELIQERGKELRSQRIDKKYAETEEKILNRIKKEAEDDLADVGPLIRALEIVAKNRVMYKNPMGYGSPASANNLQIVNLILPQQAEIANSVTLNSQGEVIAVGSRNMATLPIDSVQKMFNQMDKEKGIGYVSKAT